MIRVSFVVCIICLFFFSCEDKPGEGGRASVQGKVYVKDFNGNCTVLLDSFYGIDEEVFIIAGDDPSYFERVRTGPDGTFWFPYLRRGKYEVYALSEPCNIPGELETVGFEIEIKERKEEIITEDIVVLR
ncbi:MAG: hypothetical protein WBG42_12480 [Cryomorphaceae bacterium]